MVQIDCYYAHPVRDFAASDEALRLRQVGENNYITYKGPKLDTTTKTRREIEISLPDGLQSAAEAAELVEADDLCTSFGEVMTGRRAHRAQTENDELHGGSRDWL